MKMSTITILIAGVIALIVGIYLVMDIFALGKPAIQPGERVVMQGNVAAPTEPDENPVEIEVQTIAEGLVVPWSIVFTSSNRILVTERPGNIRSVNVQTGEVSDPLITFPETATGGEVGLMGMALDPNYSSNKNLYVCLGYRAGSGISNKIVKLTDNATTITEESTILDRFPSASNHAGCRLEIGPDDKLYVTTGDALDASLAQNRNSLAGKILRINTDGSIPEDNPFNNAIYSYGHRNPQGIAWHPETQTMFSTEHGPSGFDGPGGGDEINVIEAGQNYGWPLVSHEKTQKGTEAPKVVFTPAVAPAGAAFYTGNDIPQFRNNFFFGGLRGEGLFRVVLDENDTTQISYYEKLAEIDVGRVRDVVTGPDGKLYFTSSNRDGRGSPIEGDDKIYALTAE